jgi:sulfatase maturation enzyme AslB (radical SAM superfamily)
VYYGGVEPQYSLDNLFKVMNNVGNDLHIAWGGGEPTVRKDFNDLFSKVNNKFHPKTQRVFTNALKYSQPLQEALDSRATSITTSIDAGVEDTFRKVRDSKGLDKVLKFLERYSKNSPDLVTIKYIFTTDNYDSYNLIQFVKNIREHNLIKCNYLISADFNYETLEEDIVFSIISLYFMLYSEGIYAVSFDDHIFHKVRTIGKGVNSYIDNLEVVSEQVQAVKDAIRSFSEKKGNNIIIWGTGEFSEYLFDTAEDNSFVVSGIVDGMEEKWGTDFMGFEVQSPQSLVDTELDIVIASVNFYGEIFNKLISMGISKNRVIPNFLL